MKQTLTWYHIIHAGKLDITSYVDQLKGTFYPVCACFCESEKNDHYHMLALANYCLSWRQKNNIVKRHGKNTKIKWTQIECNNHMANVIHYIMCDSQGHELAKNNSGSKNNKYIHKHTKCLGIFDVCDGKHHASYRENLHDMFGGHEIDSCECSWARKQRRIKRTSNYFNDSKKLDKFFDEMMVDNLMKVEEFMEEERILEDCWDKWWKARENSVAAYSGTGATTTLGES